MAVEAYDVVVEAYDVVVRNELTGEIVTVAVCCEDGNTAQIDALVHLFKTKGWRKAVALVPEPPQPAQ